MVSLKKSSVAIITSVVSVVMFVAAIGISLLKPNSTNPKVPDNSMASEVLDNSMVPAALPAAALKRVPTRLTSSNANKKANEKSIVVRHGNSQIKLFEGDEVIVGGIDEKGEVYVKTRQRNQKDIEFLSAALKSRRDAMCENDNDDSNESVFWDDDNNILSPPLGRTDTVELQSISSNVNKKAIRKDSVIVHRKDSQIVITPDKTIWAFMKEKINEEINPNFILKLKKVTPEQQNIYGKELQETNDNNNIWQSLKLISLEKQVEVKADLVIDSNIDEEEWEENDQHNSIDLESIRMGDFYVK